MIALHIESNSSRFGIKGDEDFGGGLKGIYQVESGAFSADEGTGGFGAQLRNTFVGFSSGWGTVKIGRHDSPYKDLGRVLDAFNEQVGDARTLIGATAGSAGSRGWDLRPNNMIRYESPSFGGLQVIGLHSNSDGGTPTFGAESAAASTSVNSLAVRWTSGPLFIGGGYEKHGLTPDEETGMRLVAQYNFGAFKLGGLYETLKDLGGASGADRNVMGLVGSIKLGGNTTVDLHWYEADALDTAANTGGSIMAVGVHHNLSKTTQVYANYANADNDPGTAGYNVASANGGHGTSGLPAPTTAGASPTGMSVGVILNF